jgi:DNA repair photolyase
MEKKNNMYNLSVEQWSPFAGCEHECVYCKSSFQRQLKRWAKKNCPGCYEFVPHTHPERLGQKLPKTKHMQFIFTCSSGDIAFCSTEYLEKIIARIQSEPGKTFLIQSKAPGTFNRATFPKNVILGTTLETNRDELCEGTSKAPKPSQRYNDFLKVNHQLKMVTIEPVIDFNLDGMISWVENINPCMVWLGYDSGKNKLPEPKLEKVKSLHWQLSEKGFVVILKTIRKAWHEQ